MLLKTREIFFFKKRDKRVSPGLYAWVFLDQKLSHAYILLANMHTDTHVFLRIISNAMEMLIKLSIYNKGR
jgi:hypothetical protein